MTQTQPHLPLQLSALASIEGHREPRLWTPSQLDLSIRENSYGYGVIDFGRLIGLPLDPWQEDLVIRMGELSLERDDNGNRVPLRRRVLISLARQNGKTLMVEVLSLYWMFVERHPLIIGMNANTSDAIDVMKEIAEFAYKSEFLVPLIRRVTEGNMDPKFQTTEGSTYKPVAANEKAGRGKRAQRAVIDELRLQKNWKAYNAVIPAMSAQKNAQAVFITNAGYDDSVVLNSLRASALEYISTGTGDEHLALYEWSAPDGADIYDPNVWAYANPSLGVRKTHIAMKSEADTAKTGTVEEANFRNEHLCMHVRTMDAAINPDRWADCFSEDIDWKDASKKSVMFLDVSLNQTRASLCAAFELPDGTIQVGVKESWSEQRMKFLARDLKAILKDEKPKAFGWFPIGPSAAYASSLKTLKIPGVTIQEVTGEVADSCMGLADEVFSKRIVHSSPAGDLLTTQITAVAKLWTGDRWKFTRKGVGDCDAAYAAAGAINLVRTMPPPQKFFVRTPQQKGE